MGFAFFTTNVQKWKRKHFYSVGCFSSFDNEICQVMKKSYQSSVVSTTICHLKGLYMNQLPSTFLLNSNFMSETPLAQCIGQRLFEALDTSSKQSLASETSPVFSIVFESCCYLLTLNKFIDSQGFFKILSWKILKRNVRISRAGFLFPKASRVVIQCHDFRHSPKISGKTLDALLNNNNLGFWFSEQCYSVSPWRCLVFYFFAKVSKIRALPRLKS